MIVPRYADPDQRKMLPEIDDILHHRGAVRQGVTLYVFDWHSLCGFVHYQDSNCDSPIGSRLRRWPASTQRSIVFNVMACMVAMLPDRGGNADQDLLLR
jgi:hypothetical protein